ncbi:MAG: SPOR domain-containing protein [Terriglobales bacterium]|jgi:DedD protein
MAASEDTEITLGTGKMLALFFGLVALCAVFFGMGFSLGKNSGKSTVELQGAMGTSTVRPTAVKAAESHPSSDLSFYKAVEQKDPQADLTAKSSDTPPSAATKTAPADADAPPDPAAIGGQNSYFVQVAAVSKQEDAAALVDALKKKQYAAFAASAGGDKLFHVQVGPFSDIKDAEGARGQLVKDGYNPILKK